MSFINKDSQTNLHIKITNKGRELAAQGALTFSSFAIGDSEIDYGFLDRYNIPTDKISILSPVDNQQGIKYPIRRLGTSNSFRNPLQQAPVAQKRIKNTAKERGFFALKDNANPGLGFNFKTGADALTKGVFTIDPASLVNNSDSFQLNETTFNAAVGDYLLVVWPHAQTQTSHLNGVLPLAAPHAMSWYKAKAVNIANRSVVVDRLIPNMDNNTSGNYAGFEAPSVYVFPGGDSIRYYYGPDSPGAYWDANSLKFDVLQNASHQDIPVWDLSVVYSSGVPGTTPDSNPKTYNSSLYESIKRYLSNPNPTLPVGVIHYTNYAVDNFYGEGFYDDTFQLYLPTIMYHNSATKVYGANFKAGKDEKTMAGGVGDFSIAYRDLLDSKNEVVGKVFNSLKMAIIEQPEIVSALMFRSNRNWTLPPFRYLEASGSAGNSDLYFTYQLTSRQRNEGDGGYALRTALHSQDIRLISKTDMNTLRYVEFKLDSADLKFLQSPENIASGNGGVGYTATGIKLLYQFVPTGEVPDSDRWSVIDYTPNIQNYSTWRDTGLNSNDLSGQIYRVEGSVMRANREQGLVNSSLLYNLDYLGGNSSELKFGEEVFLLGNIKADIQATAYGTQFLLKLGQGEYSTSLNPTWTSGNPVLISEVGIYDNNNNLVMIGKLAAPLSKDNFNVRLIKMDFDF